MRFRLRGLVELVGGAEGEAGEETSAAPQHQPGEAPSGRETEPAEVRGRGQTAKRIEVASVDPHPTHPGI